MEQRQLNGYIKSWLKSTSYLAVGLSVGRGAGGVNGGGYRLFDFEEHDAIAFRQEPMQVSGLFQQVVE